MNCDDWDPLNDPRTPEMLDVLEAVIDKIEIFRLIDKMMPLEGEQEEEFLKDVRELVEEKDPIGARILANCGYDPQKVDTRAWKEKIAIARRLVSKVR